LLIYDCRLGTIDFGLMIVDFGLKARKGLVFPQFKNLPIPWNLDFGTWNLTAITGGAS
jgi:hypothetical protein